MEYWMEGNCKLTIWLTHSMEQSHFWEANSRSASQEHDFINAKFEKYFTFNYTVKPLLTDLYGENHGSDKPISRMSEGKGNMVIDMKK
jgi:hypothetical protein